MVTLYVRGAEKRTRDVRQSIKRIPLPENESSESGPTKASAMRPGRSGWRRGCLLGMLILGLIGLALVPTHRRLLTHFALRFRVDDPAPSDALVLIADSSEVVDVYRRAKAPVVLIAAGD